MTSPAATTPQPKLARSPRPRPLLRTTVGSKLVVAITGAALVLFVIAHLIGNLQVFLGREALNKYAYFLKSVPELLWPARLALLTAFVVHIVFAIRLKLQTGEARPVGYMHQRMLVTSKAARSMLWTGLAILVFVAFHLAHFTFGWIHGAFGPEGVSGSVLALRDPLGHHDVYGMVIDGFRRTPITLAYVVAMLLLAPHLYHGGTSMLRTWGWDNDRVNPVVRRVGPAVAALVLAGNLAIPLAIWSGLVGGGR